MPAETEQMFHWLIERLPSGVVALDEQGGVVYSNPAAAKILATPVETLLEAGLNDVFARSAPPVSAASLISGGEKQLELRLPDGKWISLHAVPFGREGMSVLLILTDVSALRKVDEMKIQFLTETLHLIRTPLTTVSSALSMVASGRVGELPEKAKRLCAVSMTETRRLVGLLDSLREALLLESGLIEKDLILEPVDLAEMLPAVLKEAVKLPGASEERFRLDLPDGLPPVSADRERLRSVLIELLTNALRYSKPDGEITVSAEDRGDSVALRVSDSGGGIPEDELVQVFERGFRGTAPENQKSGGAGLGLYIVKGLVEAMGGEVNIDSAPNIGATVELLLPSASSQ